MMTILLAGIVLFVVINFAALTFIGNFMGSQDCSSAVQGFQLW